MRDTSIDPVEVRDWIIERIETNAPGARGETPGSAALHTGRIDALVDLAVNFELCSRDEETLVRAWQNTPATRAWVKSWAANYSSISAPQAGGRADVSSHISRVTEGDDSCAT
jgi:hypothetical protein